VRVGRKIHPSSSIMYFTKHLSLFALVATVAVNAQSASPTDTSNGATSTTDDTAAPTSTDGISPCILMCVTSAAQAGGCASITDFSCVCTSAAFQDAAMTCLQTSCTPDDLINALTLQSEKCAGFAATSDSGAATSTDDSGATSTDDSGATSTDDSGATPTDSSIPTDTGTAAATGTATGATGTAGGSATGAGTGAATGTGTASVSASSAASSTPATSNASTLTVIYTSLLAVVGAVVGGLTF